MRHAGSDLRDTIAENFGQIQKIPAVIRTAMSAQEVKGGRFGSQFSSSSSKGFQAQSDPGGSSGKAERETETGQKQSVREVGQSLVDDIESEEGTDEGEAEGEDEGEAEEITDKNLLEEGEGEENEVFEGGEGETGGLERTSGTQDVGKFFKTGYKIASNNQDRQSSSKTALRARRAKTATKGSVSWKPSIKTYSSNSLKDTQLSFVRLQFFVRLL